MTVPAWAWVAWIVATLGAFAILEGIALVNRHDGDTLSENTRRWIGLTSQRRWVRVTGAALFAAVVCGFAGWFVPHILGG